MSTFHKSTKIMSGFLIFMDTYIAWEKHSINTLIAKVENLQGITKHVQEFVFILNIWVTPLG